MSRFGNRHVALGIHVEKGDRVMTNCPCLLLDQHPFRSGESVDQLD